MSSETITIKLSLPRRLHKRGRAHAHRLGITLQQYYLEGARNHADCQDELVLEERRSLAAEVVEPSDPTPSVEEPPSPDRLQLLESRVDNLEARLGRLEPRDLVPSEEEEDALMEAGYLAQQAQLDEWELNGAAPPDPVVVRGLSAESVEV